MTTAMEAKMGQSVSSFIVFPQNHIRISPRSEKELISLSNTEIRDLIYKVYLNKELYAQFSRSWRRVIKQVEKYTKDVYIPGAVVKKWADFFKYVLMKKEDGRERHLQNVANTTSKQLRTTKQSLRNRSSLPIYQRKMVNDTDQELFIKTANLDRLMEANSWCEAAEKVINHIAWEDFKKEFELNEQDLSEYSYLMLDDTCSRLNQFVNKTAVLARVKDQKGFEKYLQNNPQNKQFREGIDIWSVDFLELERLVRGFEKMAETQVAYDEHGEIVGIATSKEE